MTSIRRLALLLVAVGLMAVPAVAQESYTNEDLERLDAGDAYTNEDVAKLAPLPVQAGPLVELSAPAATSDDRWMDAETQRSAEYRALEFYRDRLRAELSYEMARIDAAYSVGGGDFTGSQRQGLKSKLEGKLNRMHREIYLLEWEMARLEGRVLPTPDLRR